MPKKPVKRGAAKRSASGTAEKKRAKAATTKPARPAAKGKSAAHSGVAPAKRGRATAAESQLDAETEYFHRTLRENAQVGSDTLLSPGQTHAVTTDADGRPTIARRRFSAR